MAVLISLRWKPGNKSTLKWLLPSGLGLACVVFFFSWFLLGIRQRPRRRGHDAVQGMLDRGYFRSPSTGMEFRVVTPGPVTLGPSPTIRDPRTHALYRRTEAPRLQTRTVDRPFLLGVYEVTQETYQKVMGANPSSSVGTRRPVDGVLYEEAIRFCEQLRRLDERALDCPPSYRLPHSDEFIRAMTGADSARPWAGDSATYGWVKSNSDKRTHEVGQRKAFPHGHHDLVGNVCEWVSDTDYHGSELPEGSWVDDAYVRAHPSMKRYILYPYGIWYEQLEQRVPPTQTQIHRTIGGSYKKGATCGCIMGDWHANAVRSRLNMDWDLLFEVLETRSRSVVHLPSGPTPVEQEIRWPETGFRVALPWPSGYTYTPR